jgi:hypothetical protein
MSAFPPLATELRTSLLVRFVPLSDSCAAQKSRTGGGSFLVVSDSRHHLFGMSILAQIVSDDRLAAAYEWLCRRRRDYSANSDVWAFSRDWAREKERIKGETLSGNYRVSLLWPIFVAAGFDI